MSFPDSRGGHSGWQGNRTSKCLQAALVPPPSLHCQGENGRVVSPEREDALCPLSIPHYTTSTLRGLLHAAPGLPPSFFQPSVLQHKDINLPALFWELPGDKEELYHQLFNCLLKKSTSDKDCLSRHLCLSKITNKYASMPYLSHPFCPGKWKTILAGLGILTEVLGPRQEVR